ncbi:histidine kinase dimerization/phospho-acceptor domain-containing protein [Oscillatoria sp. CS-180]|uniref:sensor histidine kinase n=1 Tax=Oscillatoria sp. CS-180 TaxID=3021720 RepID=UPI00232D536E|nr:histidine kinase dimerization/phospho-acceptor domain-containing protein [Oscillatoria sp. CS-180]MDB9528657.1 histidine kinase dimerization/phospho-acceptor domain-containing protein [Oscillatoria sp. CS-180]
MSFPPLSRFIHYVPASLASDDPSRWLENCLTEGLDRLVLVNEEQAPVRVLTLHQLFDVVDFSVSFSPTAGGSEPGRNPVKSIPQNLMEASTISLQIVDITASTIDVAERVALDPDLCWVVVDKHQQYLGLLNKTRLLAIVFRELGLEDSSRRGNLETSASESNTALLTYLGHELKTPLTSLLGLSSLLRTGGLGELNPRQNRYVSLIQQHCRRLAAWVNTLIDLGRIEGGTLRLVPQMVDLSKVWQEAYRQAALRTGQENTSAPSLPEILDSTGDAIALVADPARLQQMLSCLMQTVLAIQSTAQHSALSLEIDVRKGWIGFTISGLDDWLPAEQLSQTTLALPFPVTSETSTSIPAEMGHWLEWLLVRKLAQQHQGEFVLSVHQDGKICPSLILPMSPGLALNTNSRFLLVVAPPDKDFLKVLWQQTDHLDYRLLTTHDLKDAVEIASRLPINALLVLIHSRQTIKELRLMKTSLKKIEGLTVALVPTHYSSMLGELPVDRESIWPTDSLGSILLQPATAVPPTSRLTILYIKTSEQVDTSDQRFPQIFHTFGCRVLEVDDLEQASLLRRVWQPNVAVLDPAIASPASYLERLGQSPELSSLPLITLTMAATQAAHAINSLTVFPCLVAESAWNTPEATERLTAWLIQALQLAATDKK